MNKGTTEIETQGYGPRFRVRCLATNGAKSPTRPMTEVIESAQCRHRLRYEKKCERGKAYHARRLASLSDDPGVIDDQISKTGSLM